MEFGVLSAPLQSLKGRTEMSKMIGRQIIPKDLKKFGDPGFSLRLNVSSCKSRTAIYWQTTSKWNGGFIMFSSVYSHLKIRTVVSTVAQNGQTKM